MDLRETDKALKSGCVERGGVTYGCHVDGFGTEEPAAGCVAVEVSPDECTFGTLTGGRARRSRWTCPHWRKVATPQNPQTGE